MQAQKEAILEEEEEDKNVAHSTKLTLYLSYLEKCIAFMHEFINAVLGAGGGSYWLLMALPALGISTGGIALIVPGVIMSIAALQFLAKKLLPEYSKAVSTFLDNTLFLLVSVCGISGAIGFALGLAGASFMLTAQITLPIVVFALFISLVMLAYKSSEDKKILDTQEKTLTATRLLIDLAAIAGSAGAVNWFLTSSFLNVIMGASATASISAIAFPLAIAIIACSVLYFVYKVYQFYQSAQPTKLQINEANSVVTPSEKTPCQGYDKLKHHISNLRREYGSCLNSATNKNNQSLINCLPTLTFALETSDKTSKEKHELLLFATHHVKNTISDDATLKNKLETLCPNESTFNEKNGHHAIQAVFETFINTLECERAKESYREQQSNISPAPPIRQSHSLSAA